MIFRVLITAQDRLIIAQRLTRSYHKIRHPHRANGLASEKYTATEHLFSDAALKLSLRIWGDSSKNGFVVFKILWY